MILNKFHQSIPNKMKTDYLFSVIFSINRINFKRISSQSTNEITSVWHHRYSIYHDKKDIFTKYMYIFHCIINIYDIILV